MEKLNIEKDLLVVQAPNKKSFESHLTVLDDIRKCGDETGVVLKLIETNRDERKFIWEASYQEKKSYSDMHIAVMNLMFEKNIEPGKLVEETQIIGCCQKLDEMGKILKSA